MIGTLQSMFQKRTRCEGLNAPVPQGSSATVVGLGKILCWGELPLVVRWASVVLPFASDESAASIITWLDSGSVFTWAFLRTHVSSYVCSFQKRLNGQGATEDDPMTRQMGMNVNLEFTHGLQLTEGALTNCREWLGVDYSQRCIVPLLQSSPLKRSQQPLGASAKRGLEKKLRVFRMMRTPRRQTTARCMDIAFWIQRGTVCM